MTYGEYYYRIKYDMRLKDGKWVTSRPNMNIPKKMTRVVASQYYSHKLAYYWKTREEIIL